MVTRLHQAGLDLRYRLVRVYLSRIINYWFIRLIISASISLLYAYGARKCPVAFDSVKIRINTETGGEGLNDDENSARFRNGDRYRNKLFQIRLVPRKLYNKSRWEKDLCCVREGTTYKRRRTNRKIASQFSQRDNSPHAHYDRNDDQDLRKFTHLHLSRI